MPTNPDFDLDAAHKYFAAQCFNQAWDLIDKVDRTPAEDRLMEALSQASIYHWLQRPDCNDQNLSIGYWQASRIQALLGHAPAALRHAQVCLAYSQELPPFYLGYAHEALARAQNLAGNTAAAAEHLQAAIQLAGQVVDKSEREAILADLKSLQAGTSLGVNHE
jgi:hypothetical protein